MAIDYLWDSSIDISTLGVIDDDTGPWILRVVCNIIIHEDNDVLVLEAALLHNLVGVADICLQNPIPKLNTTLRSHH